MSHPPARILLVDDDEYVRRLLTRVLEALPAEVLSIANGEEAMRVAELWTPDMILLDLALPDIDGLTLLSVFRRRPTTGNTPIVVVSGLAGHPGLRSADVDGFVQKPIRTAALLRAIRAALDRRRPEPRPELKIASA
jgi:CheY-like chemotaxis protein